MSSLKDAYCTPTYVSVWDAREEGGRHLQEQSKHIIVSSRVLQT